MYNCVSFPLWASAFLNDGSLVNQGSYGFYWSATQNDSSSGYYLYFYSTYSSPFNLDGKASGFSIRCVR